GQDAKTQQRLCHAIPCRGSFEPIPARFPAFPGSRIRKLCGPAAACTGGCAPCGDNFARETQPLWPRRDFCATAPPDSALHEGIGGNGTCSPGPPLSSFARAGFPLETGDMKPFIQFLGSLKLSVIVLLALVVALAGATIVESLKGTPAAWAAV